MRRSSLLFNGSVLNFKKGFGHDPPQVCFGLSRLLFHVLHWSILRGRDNSKRKLKNIFAQTWSCRSLDRFARRQIWIFFRTWGLSAITLFQCLTASIKPQHSRHWISWMEIPCRQSESRMTSDISLFEIRLRRPQLCSNRWKFCLGWQGSSSKTLCKVSEVAARTVRGGYFPCKSLDI